MSSLRILHLADTHLFGDDTRHYGVVDTADHLRRALAHVEGERFDLVVCAGDVSEDGSEASYLRARDTLVPWAAERGARAVFAMGNHDRREAFRAVLGEGHAGVPAAEDPGSPIVSIEESGGWRTIVLDTSVPGAGYGALDDAQFGLLGAALETPAKHGTIVVMHHPPVPAQTDLLDALALGPEDVNAFWAVVRGSDVRVVLSGHYHHPIVEFVAGVPVVVAPGVANLARAFEERSEESASDGFGGAVIVASAERVRIIPFVRPVTDDEVFRFESADVRKIIEVAGRPPATQSLEPSHGSTS